MSEVKDLEKDLNKWLKAEHGFTDLDIWLEEFEGNISCGCDHGCNGKTLDMAAQAAYIIRELSKKNEKKAQEIANMPPIKAGIEWFKESRTPVAKRINDLMKKWPGRDRK